MATSRIYEMIIFSLQYLIFCVLILVLFAIIRGILKKKYSGLFFICLLLVLVSAIRVNAGSDYYNYYVMYNDSIRYFKSISDVFLSGIQSGFLTLSFLTKTYLQGDNTIFGVVSFVTVFVNYYFVKKYSPYPLTSMAIWLMMGFYLISNNLLKQYLAMVVMMIAFEQLMKKQYVGYILCTLIATNFHITALFVSGIFYLAKLIKLNRNNVLLMFLGSGLVTLVLPFFLRLLIRIPIFSKYEFYIFDQVTKLDLKLTLNSVFMIVCYLLIVAYIGNLIKKYEINNILVDSLIKLIIIGICFAIISLRLYYLSRISFYFFQFLPLLFPIVLSELPSLKIRNSTRKIVYTFLVGYCFVFTIISGENNYYNYSTIFNDEPLPVLEFVLRRD